MIPTLKFTLGSMLRGSTFKRVSPIPFTLASSMSDCVFIVEYTIFHEGCDPIDRAPNALLCSSSAFILPSIMEWPLTYISYNSYNFLRNIHSVYLIQATLARNTVMLPFIPSYIINNNLAIKTFHTIHLIRNEIVIRKILTNSFHSKVSLTLQQPSAIKISQKSTFK